MEAGAGFVPPVYRSPMTPPSRAPGGWSTQQLAEFVAAISATDEAPVALRLGVERIAEAVGARTAAVVLDGAVAAAQGWLAGTLPTEALLHAAATGGGYVPMPAVGEVGAAVARLEVGETPPGKVPDAVVVVRPGALADARRADAAARDGGLAGADGPAAADPGRGQAAPGALRGAVGDPAGDLPPRAAARGARRRSSATRELLGDDAARAAAARRRRTRTP